MIAQKVDIYVFSGTGNTLLVARKIRDTLLDCGAAAELHLMERSDPNQVDPDAMLGLAFPVAAQSTYPLVWEFCRNLPQSKNNAPVFMVDTLAGFSGGVVGPLKNLLLEKGYNPVAAREIIMPNNFLCRKINTESNRNCVEKGLDRAEKFARDLVAGKGRWEGLPVLQWLFWLVNRVAYPAHGGLMRRFLTPVLDKEKCSRCGMCARVCPVGNIDLDEDRYPVFSDICIACMRCFGLCPEHALRVRSAVPYFAEGIEAINE